MNNNSNKSEHSQKILDFAMRIQSINRLSKENIENPFAQFDEDYNNLPHIVKQLGDAQPSEHERNLAIFAALVVISGLLVNVKGTYHQKNVFPNLFLFVLAAAASGKSTISLCRRLVNKLNAEQLKENKRKKRAYDEEMQRYHIAKKAGNNLPMPEAPVYPVILIPADITPARLVQHLADATGTVPTIAIEEEIDSFSNSKKAHGDFSPTLRKAASSESITLSRKGENQYIECNNPKLALVMSGTFDQINGLIRNAEDGLYSRSLFYFFDAGLQWQSVAPCPNCINLTDLYDNVGNEEVYSLFHFLKRSPTEIKLTSEQWEHLDLFGETLLHELYNFHGKETAALVKRHTLMVFKICMVLSAIRKYEDEIVDQEQYCNNVDFNIAISLVQISLHCSLKVIRKLPKATSEDELNKTRIFFEKLPGEFTRKQFLDIAEPLKISVRSADRYIKDFLGSKYLKKISLGFYEKIPMATLAMSTNE